MANGNGIRGLQRTLPLDLAAPFGQAVRHESGPTIGRQLQVYLPEVYPIPSAVEFNTSVSKATAAAETNIDIGLTVQLPESNIGIVRGVTIEITDMLTTTNVTWSMLFNGAPVPGYNNLSIFPRSAPFVSNAFDSFVRVPQGVKITFNYTNTDGGTYTIGAAVSGWFWPQSLGNLWVQHGPQV